MKKTFLFLFLCIMVKYGHAQITLEATDVSGVGDAMIFPIDSLTDIIHAGPAGANQTWNFTLQDNGVMSVSNVLPSETQHSTSFPESNIAVLVGGFEGFFEKSSTDLKAWGGYGTIGTISATLKYDHGALDKVFPATYQTTFSDNFYYEIRLDAAVVSAELDLFGVDSIKLKQVTDRSVVYDGYGNVIINDANYDNCLREKKSDYHTNYFWKKDKPGLFNPNPQWVPGIVVLGTTYVPAITYDTVYTYNWWQKEMLWSVLEFSVDAQDTTTLIRYWPMPVAEVWPGDADNDGLVTVSDYYFTAANYGKTGNPRTETGFQWRGYLAPNEWNTSSNMQGIIINDRYLDANGDGIINLKDVAATIINRGRSH